MDDNNEATAKEYEQIIKEIRLGLTGDVKRDFKYLNEQADKYKDHELRKEITREIGRMIYENIPEEDRAEFDSLMQEEQNEWYLALDNVRKTHAAGQMDKALEWAEALVKKAEDAVSAGIYADDEVSEYKCFNELFETLVYAHIKKPRKQLRTPGYIPFAEIYYEYGNLLIDFRRIDDAQRALEMALRWNPVSSHILLEYAETFKLQGNLEEFFKVTNQVLETAFKSDSIAHAYRNLGYYFADKEIWKPAMDCLLFSMRFEESENAVQEMKYVWTKTDGNVEKFDGEKFKALGLVHGFRTEVNLDIIGLAMESREQLLKKGNTEQAKYFTAILYDLTGAEQFKPEERIEEDD